ncbi:hypothetical protein [Alkalinema sp. FACHB-956]|uniref:hypothetical protein n=1 Tax=Alkalinema sp. FACHB-956 TaxID=2692768 RepID=UPI001683A049|nr:hypothetical protein [Alkalinema sp. FACHB-956]MBD2328613.1 hypothetical protein [Alkalinema sp. FACHB-956]
MKPISQLLATLSAQETQLRSTTFLAPCISGGRIWTRIAGLVYTFRPEPITFAGWGLFQPRNTETARVVEIASPLMVDEYLQRLPKFHLRLILQLRDLIWLAYPSFEGDFCQRLEHLGTPGNRDLRSASYGKATGWAQDGMAPSELARGIQPVVVHLVSEGQPFDPILARRQGKIWWFHGIDRLADPRQADALRLALQQGTTPAALQFSGLTPEMRTAYQLAFAAITSRTQPEQAAQRLQAALAMGGGDLHSFQDQGDYWTVEWQTRTGQHHVSAIAKADLTVLSSGICLSDRDRDFDLQALVGVIEQQAEA